MEVKDLDGNIYDLKISKKKDKTREKSKLHTQAKEVLKEVFPRMATIDEVAVRVRRGLNLYLDIYVPSLCLVVEVHGQQHYEFIPHFHGHKHRFGRAKLNDELKKEWCEINEIRYVELAYNESADEWAEKLRRAVGRYT